MGRNRKISSTKKMADLWEKYKEFCDNQMVMSHDFSQKQSEYVSAELKKRITYTIEGFCVFIGLTRSAFYDTYEKDEKYSDMVTRMREECEVDARKKFETGELPPQLAGLWMSRHGYTTKTDTSLDTTDMGLNISIDYGGDG
jgi:hypothetical protein